VRLSHLYIAATPKCCGAFDPERLQQMLDLARRHIQHMRRRDNRQAPLQNLRQHLNALQLALAH
jgi:hypothetical protein